MATEETAARIGEGDVAPPFTAKDHDGKPFSSASLRGKPYVLFFYPKADTPGCTKESCGFRDEYEGFRKLGVAVLGASPDEPKDQDAFRRKFSFPYPLLADPDHALAHSFGTWVKKKNYGREYMGQDRSTFLVGKDGRVAHAWRGVKVDGHVAAVLEAASKLGR